MPRLIEDFALIGDLHTAALVSRQGSIEWLCVPRFDSDSVFASLLGEKENGCWTLAPTAKVVATERSYREGTLLLETTVKCEGGSVKIIDFMPRRIEIPTIVRIVEGIEGAVEMESLVACRFAFGSLPPWTRRLGDAITMTIGPDALALRGSVEFEIEPPDARARFSSCGRPKDDARVAMVSFAPGAAGRRRSVRAVERYRNRMARMGQAGCVRRPVPRRNSAFAHRTQSSDVRTDRRLRRRSDDLASGRSRWRFELGLSLRVGSRFSVYDRCARGVRLQRRSARVARLAVARAWRRARPFANHVLGQRATGIFRSTKHPGCADSRILDRYGSAMQRTCNSSSGFTAT